MAVKVVTSSGRRPRLWETMAANKVFLSKLTPSFWASLLAAAVILSRPRKHLALVLAIFRKLLGVGTVRLTSSTNTIQLTPKEKSKQPSINLRQLVQSIIPKIRLNPLMFNGHIHTLCVAAGVGGKDAPIHYRRREWESDHSSYPGHFTTDFVIPKPSQPLPRDRGLPVRTHNFTEEEWTSYLDANHDIPLVVLVHGFLGGSHEKYIRHAIDQLTGSGSQNEFSAVVINSRGCSYSRVTSSVLYHPRATWDIRQFLTWARKTWPNRKIFGIGFSIGANILCNYLGEEGSACPLTAAVLVGNPWNLDISNAVMTHSTLGMKLYQRSLGTAFRKTFERHLDQITKNTAIDVDKARKAKYLWEFDKHIQCPTWGYPSQTAYYRDVSSADAVMGIHIPVLALHAEDDPVCTDLAVPYDMIEASPYVVLCSTSIGGHLGWFESDGGRWSNKIVSIGSLLIPSAPMLRILRSKHSSGS